MAIRRRAAVLLALTLLSGVPAKAAEKAEKKKGGGESFIQLPSLTATVFSLGARAVLTVDVGVDVPDAKLRQKASMSVPRLRDAFTRAILLYAPTLPSRAPPDPDEIGRLLQTEADRTLGRPGAVVLLGTVMIN